MTSNFTPAAIASSAALLTSGAGMNSTLASIGPTCSHASRTVSNTGTPSTSPPPLPGVTPATMCVPYERISRVRVSPSRPVMPCTSTRRALSVRIAMHPLAALCYPELVQTQDRQTDITAPVPLEKALDLARQTLDAAAAPCFLTRDVEHRHLSVKRKNLRDTRLHTDFRRAITAERMVKGHRAARHRLEAERLARIAIGVVAHCRVDHGRISDQVAQPRGAELRRVILPIALKRNRQKGPRALKDGDRLLFGVAAQT